VTTKPTVSRKIYARRPNGTCLETASELKSAEFGNEFQTFNT